MLAQVLINQPSDILAYLITVRRSFQPLQLALLPEPASRETYAQKAVQYVFLKAKFACVGFVSRYSTCLKAEREFKA